MTEILRQPEASKSLDGVRHIQGYPPLPPALGGARTEIATAQAGRLSFYCDGPADAPPLLLIHSINAAASAYEMKPVYERYASSHHVYAPDLPGYGFSERSDRDYSPRLMTDAIHAMTDEIRKRHGDAPIDAVALSLSCEFLARAASERPDRYRSVALISPTGMDRRGPRIGEPGSDRGMKPVYGFVNFPLWRQGIFDLLNTKRSQRYFLERTWGSKNIDEGLLDYDHLSANQPGGRYAPFHFLSGYLFSNDITRIYGALGMPVWMSHGVRGDFQDYAQAREFAQRPNWRLDVFQTGALPFFEEPDAFGAKLDAFLAGASGGHYGNELDGLRASAEGGHGR